MKEFFGFRKMISTVFIKILYVIGALVLTIGGIVMPFINDEWILPGIGAVILGNLVWRVLCEGWILLFSMHEILAKIENNSR